MEGQLEYKRKKRGRGTEAERNRWGTVREKESSRPRRTDSGFHPPVMLIDFNLP